jgi:hypothetical protein
MANFLFIKFVYVLGKVTNLLDILRCYFTRVDPKEISWPLGTGSKHHEVFQTLWCS